MSTRKIAFFALALVVAAMLSGCLVGERRGYYFGPERGHYYRPVHRVHGWGSATPPVGPDSRADG